jgi:hypothetical protein
MSTRIEFTGLTAHLATMFTDDNPHISVDPNADEDSLPSPWGGHFFKVGESRIAGSAVDEFGGGAQRDHHAPTREANLAFGADLERALCLRRAINPADGGRQRDPLRRLDHRLPIGPF